MSDAEAVFNALTGELDYPMFIVTTAAEGQQAGCLVGFATQASMDPPRFLVCLSKANRTYRVAWHADALAVHLVPREAEDLALLFGGETGDEVDKFERCGWREGARGLPLLDRCASWFAGEVLERFPAGDHVGFLLHPFDGRKGHDESPFPFHRAKRIEPGHEP